MSQRRLSSLFTTFLAVLAALSASFAAGEEAHANHWSVDSFPSVDGSFDKAVSAWGNYLGHCTGSGVALYGYDGSEYGDDAYAFVPRLGACEIYFNVDIRKNYKRAWFCSVMVHEMGHVAGFEHSPDPLDIMHAENPVYWRKCLTRREARKLRRRGAMVDSSIADWSRKVIGRSARRPRAPQPRLTRALKRGRLEVRRIATLQVR